MAPSDYYVNVGAASRGPIPLEEVRRLWQSGLLDSQSLYWRPGMEQWQPLPEILPQVLAGQGSAALVPPLRPHGVPSRPQPTSNLAIASLVLGISAFFFCVTGIAGIILGHMARREIRLSNGQLGGDGMAVAGLVMSYVATVALLMPLLILLAMFIFAGIALPMLPNS